MLILGAHYSIAGGINNSVDRALKYKANALQIFTWNARGWKSSELSEEDVKLFKKKKKELDAVVAHAIYLLNIANPGKEQYLKSKNALRDGLQRTDDLDIPYLILHPGNHLGSGEGAGLKKIYTAINDIYSKGKIKTSILLETTAGTGSSIGHSFEQLAFLIKNIRKKSRVGICLDTCHIFTAGYDIRDKKSYNKTIRAFDKIIGLKYLKAIHINDSKHPLGSKKDRHEHIGKGYIGLEAVNLLINDKRLETVPKFLETPKETTYPEDPESVIDMDMENYRVLRELYRG